MRKLGQGASAVAYEAEELATGRRVCVKLFGSDLSPKSRDRARLEHEVLHALEGHAHVLPAIAVQQTPHGRMFMVTALLEGRTLQEEGRCAPQAFEEIRSWATELMRERVRRLGKPGTCARVCRSCLASKAHARRA